MFICSLASGRFVNIQFNVDNIIRGDKLEPLPCVCLLCADLVVCQLSVIKPVGQTVGRLYLTRFQSGLAPLIICLPGYETAEVPVAHVCLILLVSGSAPCCVT